MADADPVGVRVLWRGALSYTGTLPASIPAMRWTPGGDRSDIEDRRGEGGGGLNFGGFSGAHLGLGGTLVLVVLSLIFRTNLFNGGGADPAATRPAVDTPTANREVDFV